MKTKLVPFTAAIVGFITGCGVLFAHHGASAYDRRKLTNFKATIAEFRYINPHVQIFFDAKDDKGATVRWNCESINPGMLSKQGWTRNTLKPGDQVTLVAFPAKEGAPVCLLQKLILPDGKTLDTVLLD